MKTITPLARFVLSALFLTATGISVAQSPPGRDPYNPPPGHGGVPPGQAKKHGNDGMPPGQAKKHGDDNMPPGQAKKYGRDYHFEGDDRSRFYGYYRGDVDRWRGRKRPVFVTGRAIPREYVVRAVPESY
jgi:hypothetical protein